MKLILTCEHAVPDIPLAYQVLFKENPEVLATHEGFDPGAFDLFSELKKLADFSEFQIIGRLLVEVNRSIGHKSLFSRFSQILNKEQRKELLDAYYHPYRYKIEQEIKKHIENGQQVLHVSVHSFTPVLNDIERNCDIGLLFDPGRKKEKEVCDEIKSNLLEENPALKIRFNYPYLGKADGFTTYLRKIFPENYVGIELEINQKWVKENELDTSIKKDIFRSMKTLNNKKPQN